MGRIRNFVGKAVASLGIIAVLYACDANIQHSPSPSKDIVESVDTTTFTLDIYNHNGDFNTFSSHNKKDTSNGLSNNSLDTILPDIHQDDRKDVSVDFNNIINETKTLILRGVPGFGRTLSKCYNLQLATEASGSEEIPNDTDLRFYEDQSVLLFQNFSEMFYNEPTGSNTGIIFMGVGALADYTCPNFGIVNTPISREGTNPYFINNPHPESINPEEWNRELNLKVPLIQEGVYCLTNYNNTRLFRFRVAKIEPESVTIDYHDLGSTDVVTYRCDSLGFCDENVEVICIGCSRSDEPYLERVREFQGIAKECLERYIDRELPVNLKQIIVPYSLSYCESSECLEQGHGGPFVSVNGFQGIIKENENRITSLSDLRLDVHENAHVFYYWLISKRQAPSWFNEGFSIQAQARLDCHPNQFDSGFYIGTNEYESIRDGLIELGDYHQSAYGRGSLFFSGLEIDFGCGLDCASQIWQVLASEGNQDRVISNREIKDAAELVTNEDLTNFFSLLKIVYE